VVTAAFQLVTQLALFAEKGAAPAGGAPAPDAPGNPFGMLGGPLPLIIILFVVFYFLIMRPQKREQSRRQEMLANVKKTDRVVTIGGIYGVVANVQRESDELTLVVDEATNTKLRVTLSSVARVVGDGSAAENDKK
jgi:preprotein translocase subunit YajC